MKPTKTPTHVPGAFVIIELVDLQLLSENDRTQCFFEVRWGTTFSARSAKQTPHRGIITFTERLKAPVPHLGSRRQPLTLHLFGIVGKTDLEVELAWCPIPALDILSGKRIRLSVHLKAPPSPTSLDPTAYVLQTAFFFSDESAGGLSATGMRPSEVPLSDTNGNPIFGQKLNLGDGGGYVSGAGGGLDRSSKSSSLSGLGGGGSGANLAASFGSHTGIARDLLAQMQRLKVTVETQTDITGPVFSANTPKGMHAAAAHFGNSSSSNNSNNNNNNNPPNISQIVQKDDNDVKNENANDDRSVSATATSRGRSAMPMDERSASAIKSQFANFYAKDIANRDPNNPQLSASEQALKDQQHLRDTIDDDPTGWGLKKPVDLLAMKRSVAAWPKDEVEGLITYGEQMKRYADTLEKQNARMVIHQMRDAVTELRDLGGIVSNPRSASRLQSQSVASEHISRSNSIYNNNYSRQQQQQQPRGGSAPPSIRSPGVSRSQSMTVGGGGGNNNSNNNVMNNIPPSRSVSTFSQNVLGFGGDDDDEANVHNFEEVNGYYGPYVNRNSNRSRMGSPEYVTRIEMNRGVPLNENDRDHVQNHFDEL